MNTVKSRQPVKLINLIMFSAFLVLINTGCDFFLPNKPPYVEKVLPADSAVFTIGQVVTFQVNAYDVDGLIIHVAFTTPNAAVYIDDTAPYEFAWPTAGLTVGYHKVEIKAIDNEDEPYIISSTVHLIGALASYAGKDTTFTDSRTTYILEAGVPVNSQGTWTIISGTGGQISDLHNPNASFTGISCQAYTLRWTVSNGVAEVFDEVTIGFSYQPSQAHAGADQQIADDRTSTVLQAIAPTAGVGYWRNAPGNRGFISDTTLPAAIFTGLRCSVYSLIWSVSTPCGISSDTVEIRFDLPLADADAGPDQMHIDGRTTATLDANKPAAALGTWTVMAGRNGQFSSVNDPVAVFTGQLCEKYILRWTQSTPCESNYDEMTITFTDLPSIANAGADQTLYDGSISARLNAATPDHGSGIWTITSGGSGSFSDSADPKSVFTGTLCQIFVLRWTVSTLCGSTFDEVTVGLNQVDIIADAGPDERIAVGTVATTLRGNAPGAGTTGTWSIVSGEGGVLDEVNKPGARFTGIPGQVYSLKWTLSGTCLENSDLVIIAFITYQEMIDPRDGKTYQTIRLGKQEWMAENLNYLTPGSYVNDNKDENAAKYGRLYDWNAAASACPSGWHLSSDAEWRQLEVLAGMDESTSLLEGYRGLYEGGLLKDEGTSYWLAPNEGSTNIFGFGVRAAGYRTPDGIFGGIKTDTGLWTSTENTTGKALIRAFHLSHTQVGRYWYDKGFGFSVRCAKK